MLLRQPNRLLFAICGCLGLISIAGCGDAGPENQAQQRRDPRPDEKPNADQGVDGVPPALPVVDNDDDGASNPLVRGLRSLINTSPILADEDTAGLEDVLDNADRTLNRIKHENRKALANVNRRARLRNTGSPNIVLIFIEQLGIRDLGCYGQDRISTPHIDGIARDGIQFTNGYAGSPDPATSAWCLLTGLNSGHGSRTQSASIMLLDRETTLAETLWVAGYSTAFIGHWGLKTEPSMNDPAKHGFEEWFGTLDVEENAEPSPGEFWSNGAKIKLLPDESTSQRTADDVFTNEAVSYIARNNSGRPYFLCLSYLRAQSPAGVSESTDAEYGTSAWTDSQKRYAQSISQLDRNVGILLNRLRQLSAIDDTLIVLTSLTGPHGVDGHVRAFFAGSGEYRTTGVDLAEGRLRVPLIMHWPRRTRSGAVTDFTCANWDLFTTMIDVVRAQQRPSRLDGVSLLPLFAGKMPKQHDLLYWQTQTKNSSQGVRMGRWKGIRRAGSTEIELFDLVSDPAETTNVADQHPKVVEQITRPAG